MRVLRTPCDCCCTSSATPITDGLPTAYTAMRTMSLDSNTFEEDTDSEVWIRCNAMMALAFLARRTRMTIPR